MAEKSPAAPHLQPTKKNEKREQVLKKPRKPASENSRRKNAKRKWKRKNAKRRNGKKRSLKKDTVNLSPIR